MMSSHTVLLALCVVTVALLTAGGMAMRSVSRIWLRHLAEQELRGSRAAHAYLERPQRLIIAASSTVALVLVLSGGFLATDYARQPVRLALALAAYAAAMIVVGQLIPRAIARRFAPAVASLLSPLLQAAAIVTTPFIAMSRIASRPFERTKPGETGTERDAIQDLLREGELEGMGEREEMDIITGVMSFGEKLVRDVMIPRSEIFAIDRSASAREVAEEFATSAFSRVPVFEGSLDHVVGMVHAFDVLKTGGQRHAALRPVAIAQDATPCKELLFRMLRRSQHLALVQDAQQHTVGLVTLEDLLEELVGDIRDEHDEPAPRGEG